MPLTRLLLDLPPCIKWDFRRKTVIRSRGAADLGIKDVAAYETVYKKDQRGELTVIAGERFLIQINSDGSNDPSLLYSTAKSIKLDDLAAK